MAEQDKYLEMSDDEFMAALEEESYRPQEDDNNNVEDTNQSEEPEDESTEEPDTEHTDDEADADTGSEDDESEEEDDEGNTQIENSSDNEEAKEPDEKSGEDEIEAKSDESETNENPVEDGKETDKINYEEQYKALLSDNDRLKGFENFYNEVTSEFTANGKKVRGFDDPKKIIEAQQMAAGFSDKMASFSKYKPFMNSIKDNGFLDNPDRFNLAMQLLDGDQEAIKKHIKDLEIDPFEMDMENINYQSKNQVSSNLEMAYGDIMESAKANKVDAQVQEIINKGWDDNSVVELLEDPQSSADLINHISSGAYDVVQERIAEKKRTDVHNVYSRKPMIEQYREAAREIEGEYMQHLNAQQQAQMQDAGSQEPSEEAIQAEMARIEEERNTEYRAQVEQKNAKADEARKKATSVSKKKPRTKTKKTVFDPSTANDDEFTKYLDSIMYS